MDISNFKIYTKKELKQFSKNQIIELYLNQQDILLQILNNQNKIEKQIEKLEDKINEPKKTSRNSSIPSSKDITKKRAVEKQKGQKKKGPPKGHKGISRKLKLHADRKVYSMIERNPRTGKTLYSNSNSFSTHQVIDLKSSIDFEVIDIKRQITTGEDGKTVTAPNPSWVRDNAVFGKKFEAFITVLRNRFAMPWNKIREYIMLFGNLNISEGVLARVFKDVKNELKTDYDSIKTVIRQSSVVGADETGEHIEGKKGWGWVFRTENATLYAITNNRSSKIVNAFLGKNFAGVLVSDFWGAYNEKMFKAGAYQKCLAHLLRDLEFVSEIERSKKLNYITKIKKIITLAIKIKKNSAFGGDLFIRKRTIVENILNKILAIEDFQTDSGNRLRKRLIKYRKHLFTFLYIQEVPHHNNGSETDIRKFVGLRKICGSFRSALNRGPLWQSVIMSIIETARKQNVNYYDFIYERLCGNSALELIKFKT